MNGFDCRPRAIRGCADGLGAVFMTEGVPNIAGRRGAAPPIAARQPALS